MIDLLTLIESMAGALRRPGALDWATVGPTIGLEFVASKSIGKDKTASALEGAVLGAAKLPVQRVLSDHPRREIMLIFPDRTLRKPGIEAVAFGTNQRVEKSRTGLGFSIVFSIDDVSCAILVDYSDSTVSGAMVRDVPRATQ